MIKIHKSENNLEERATKKEPIKILNVHCPVCSEILNSASEEYQENYCPCCGQAIDWSKYNSVKK